MSIQKAFKIIQENIDDCYVGTSVVPDKIVAAEQILGVKFPRSYTMFLEKYGVAGIFGFEIYGIIKDPATDEGCVPNGIWYTLIERKESKLPHDYIVIGDTGEGSLYVIDTAQKDENAESPVLIWDASGETEQIADSFGEFLLEQLESFM